VFRLATKVSSQAVSEARLLDLLSQLKDERTPEKVS
jgi:hypothetical protein